MKHHQRVPRSPFRIPTEEDKVRVHRIDLGGASIGGGPGRWGITDCGLGPKGLKSCGVTCEVLGNCNV